MEHYYLLPPATVREPGLSDLDAIESSALFRKTPEYLEEVKQLLVLDGFEGLSNQLSRGRRLRNLSSYLVSVSRNVIER